MGCESCKFWKPLYAPFAHKMIMSCVKEDRELSFPNWECWERKEDTEQKEKTK